MPAEDLARPGVAGSPGQPMLRRIGSLLAPYRWWLALVLVTVLVSASLGAIAPFLTRAVFDDALFPVRADGAIGSPDLERLYWLVAGLIAIPLVSALIDQLAVGGILVAPVGGASSQSLLKLTKRADGGVDEAVLAPVVFVPLLSGTLD